MTTRAYGGWSRWRRLGLLVCLSLVVVLSSSQLSTGTSDRQTSNATVTTSPLAISARAPEQSPRLVPQASLSFGWVNETQSLNTSLSARHGAAITYDGLDQVVLMFGGTCGGASVCGDTWEYRSENWTQIHPVNSPSPRSGARMTYDEADGYVVLFGGIDASNTNLNDTWIFRGGNWIQLNPSGPMPGPRRNPSLVYDPYDHYVLLFGGVNGSSFGDTWTFRAGNWTQVFPAQSPPARTDAGITVDSTDGYILLFGGWAGVSPFGDTWTFRGGSWTPLSPVSSPPGVTGDNLVFDPVSGSTLLFGGFWASGCGQYCPAGWTYSYSAGVWTNLSAQLSLSPEARWDGDAVYDVGSAAVIIQGGETNGKTFPDLWAWRVAPLTTSISSNPGVSDVGLNVSFSALPSGGTSPYSYEWSFGDGDHTTGNASVKHIYNLSGTYTVRVNVTDAIGGATSATTIEAISSALDISANANPQQTDVNQSVLFRGLVGGGSGRTTVNWSFGDGTYGALLSQTHVYTHAGTFTAMVRVNDSAGSVTASSFKVQVNQTLEMTASGPTSPKEPFQTIGFLGVITGGTNPISVVWHFGDGNGGDGIAVQHAYLSSGNYSVYVWANDSAGESVIQTIRVSILPGLAVSASASTTATDVGVPVNFNGEYSGGTPNPLFRWVFGDGNSSALLQAVHAYATPGTYFAHFWVNDSVGGSGQVEIEIRVNQTLSLSPSGPAGPVDALQEIGFLGSLSGGTTPELVTWRFGDGEGTLGTAVSHVYLLGGNYTVRVWANDSVGEAVSRTILVEVNSPLTVLVNESPEASDVELPITFRVTSTGGEPSVSLAWVLGDGGSSSGSIAEHSYTHPGIFRVRVWANDSEGQSVTTNTSVIVHAAPVATASANAASVESGVPVLFSGSESGGTSPMDFVWHFGDGQVGVGERVNHTYSTEGTYTALLWINDSVGGSSTAVVNVTVTVTSAPQPWYLGEPMLLPLFLLMGILAGFGIPRLLSRKKEGPSTPDPNGGTVAGSGAIVALEPPKVEPEPVVPTVSQTAPLDVGPIHNDRAAASKAAEETYREEAETRNLLIDTAHRNAAATVADFTACLLKWPLYLSEGDILDHVRGLVAEGVLTNSRGTKEAWELTDKGEMEWKKTWHNSVVPTTKSNSTELTSYMKRADNLDDEEDSRLEHGDGNDVDRMDGAP